MLAPGSPSTGNNGKPPMTKEPEQMSMWKAKDGRIMRVIDVTFGRFAILEVVNATGTMRRITTMGLSNFGDFLQPL